MEQELTTWYAWPYTPETWSRTWPRHWHNVITTPPGPTYTRDHRHQRHEAARDHATDITLLPPPGPTYTRDHRHQRHEATHEHAKKSTPTGLWESVSPKIWGSSPPFMAEWCLWMGSDSFFSWSVMVVSCFSWSLMVVFLILWIACVVLCCGRLLYWYSQTFIHLQVLIRSRSLW